MSEPENGMKRFQDMTLIERLRNNLQPQGTAPIVGFDFYNANEKTQQVPPQAQPA